MEKHTAKQTMHFFLLFLFFLAGMGACAPARVHRAAEEQNGSRINLRVGDILQIVLAGNPTTGYTWEVAHNNADLLELQEEVEYQAEKTSLVGSGGTFIFTFKAIAKGNSSLKLIYRRPFEKGVPPIKEYQLTILVE